MQKSIPALKESLNFLYVNELKNLCNKLALSEKGKKIELIFRILRFIEAGEKLTTPKFPKISCAKKGQIYPISKNSLMLKGAYKNDSKTRLFFIDLIGAHFHFTAFGIDWLNERWMNGHPPTYQEFADMWQKEYDKRKKSVVAPKEEWAYINFIQNYLKKFPKKGRENINAAWEKERQRHKSYIDKVFEGSDNFSNVLEINMLLKKPSS